MSLLRAEKKQLLEDLKIYNVEDLSDLDSIKLLEYPHYTRPATFRGYKVPEILSSGDHKKIALWRLKEAFRITYQ